MILSQLYGVPKVLAAALLYGGAPVPVKLTTFDHAMFVIAEGPSADAEATITVLAGSSQAMAGAEAIAFHYRMAAADSDEYGALTDAPVAGFSTGAGGDRAFLIEIDDSELPDGKPWVQVVLSLDAGTDAPGAVIAVVVPRYQSAAIETALA